MTYEVVAALVGSTVGEPLAALVQVRLGQVADSGLALPAAITSLRVSDCCVVRKEEVELKGPLPVPVEVPLLRTVFEVVALIR